MVVKDAAKQFVYFDPAFHGNRSWHQVSHVLPFSGHVEMTSQPQLPKPIPPVSEPIKGYCRRRWAPCSMPLHLHTSFLPWWENAVFSARAHPAFGWWLGHLVSAIKAKWAMEMFQMSFSCNVIPLVVLLQGVHTGIPGNQAEQWDGIKVFFMAQTCMFLYGVNRDWRIFLEDTL